ncbi:hypothetical protein [Streptomyces sp. LUP30]|uniref:hypothetical protein n=1 Tax=Streptomyces sp. LUP30 TaxID=1890285 RepID=UPI0009A08ED3|nr:hypothetical protein [Streptomyces sp. LUP30]
MTTLPTPVVTLAVSIVVKAACPLPELRLSAGAEAAGAEVAGAEVAGVEVAGSDAVVAIGETSPGLVPDALSLETPHAASRSAEANPAAEASTMR